MQDFQAFLNNKQIQLTNEQLELSKYFFDFLNDDKSSIFLLTGQTLTGKTFLSLLLYQYCLKNGIKSSYLFPTGRASRKFNYENNCNISSTIHGVIYDWKNREENVDEKYPIIVPLKDNGIDEMEKLYIYFIDNASSISDIANKDKFVFGSGRLLHDILDYTKIHKYKNKVIFIGDVTLIEPSNMNIMPALNKEYIIETFKIKPYEYTLKEQKKIMNRGMLEISNTICNAIERKDYNTLQIKSYDDTIILNDEQFIDKILELKQAYLFSQEVIIVSSNRMAIYYNMKIKEKMGKNINQLCVSDKLILTRTAYFEGHIIYSGEFIYIDSLEPTQLIIYEEIDGKKYVVVLRKANIVHYASQHPTRLNVYLYEHLLSMEENDLTLEEYIAVDKYIKKHGDIGNKIANALKVKYGYAITCTKAQDGKWKHVFVDCEYYNDNKMTQSYFKWLNTAITRSSEMLYLKNVPNINLGIDLSKKEDNIIDYKILGDKLINMIKQNIPIFNEYNIILNKIAQNLFILKFIKNNISTDIKVYYKKDLYISTVQPINTDENSVMIIDALNAIINRKIGEESNNIKLNNDVLDKIIEEIRYKLEKENLHTEIKLFPYKIRIMVNDNTEHVSLDLTYNKKNIITDRKFNYNDNIEMINKVKNILGI